MYMTSISSIIHIWSLFTMFLCFLYSIYFSRRQYVMRMFIVNLLMIFWVPLGDTSEHTEAHQHSVPSPCDYRMDIMLTFYSINKLDNRIRCAHIYMLICHCIRCTQICNSANLEPGHGRLVQVIDTWEMWIMSYILKQFQGKLSLNE